MLALLLPRKRGPENGQARDPMNRDFKCPGCGSAFQAEVERRSVREVQCPGCLRVYRVEYDNSGDDDVDIPWLNREIENPEPGHFVTGKRT